MALALRDQECERPTIGDEVLPTTCHSAFTTTGIAIGGGVAAAGIVTGILMVTTKDKNAIRIEPGAPPVRATGSGSSALFGALSGVRVSGRF